ncbi:helix-turn-helix domain-containing protein [Staphylococcus simulans]
MDLNFGITLRRIRKAKHKSIDSVSGHFISKSQVSRFERGESEITFTSLYSILNSLNISFDEFLNIHCKYQSKSEQFLVLIKKIKSYTNVENARDFNTIFIRFCLSRFTHIEIIVIKSLLSKVNSSIFLSNDEVEELADYFFRLIIGVAMNYCY